MIILSDMSFCTGCGACSAVCPAHCIKMKPDSEGFLRPVTDNSACVGCKKCLDACPVKNAEKSHHVGEPQVFCAVSTDEAVRKKSSSGGVFAALAESIFDMGGAVFGAAFDGEMRAAHRAATDKEGLLPLLGSKYVQSEAAGAYPEVRRRLLAGECVLFSGTPCQTAALYAFLGKDGDSQNLYTADVVCHGVPSPAVWKAYLREAGEKHGGDGKVTEASFRDKKKGWRNFSMRIGFADGGETRRDSRHDPMLAAMLNDLCLRPSCHKCAFRGENRRSDITLADFWGVQNVFPDLFDDGGTSAVLVNTEKGQKLLDFAHSRLVMRRARLADVLKYNPAISASPAENGHRKSFLEAYEKIGVEAAVKKELSATLLARARRSVRFFLSDMRCRGIKMKSLR